MEAPVAVRKGEPTSGVEVLGSVGGESSGTDSEGVGVRPLRSIRNVPPLGGPKSKWWEALRGMPIC